MNKRLLAFMIISLLFGAGIGYAISLHEILELKAAYDQLKSDYSKLNHNYNRLQSVYKHLVKYFFIEDPDFAMPLDENPWWGVEAWHGNPDSISEIRNGVLHLFYNGTIDYSYGNSGVFQGKHADGRFTHQLLVGNSPEDAFYGDYVIFPKSMQLSGFWLNTSFRILRIGFNRYPTVYHPNYSRVNLGITLMCAINNEPFNLTAQTLWLDIYFAGYCLNRTSIWVIPENWSYVAYEEDIHAGYFVNEVPPKDFGRWINLSIDLGNYISKTLNLIMKIDVKIIRVYGFIVFVECLGAYAEVEYDYIKTYVRSK